MSNEVKNNVQTELTLEEVNLLNDQIENLTKSKVEIVKQRDLLEGELTKVNRLLTALRKATGQT